MSATEIGAACFLLLSLAQGAAFSQTTQEQATKGRLMVATCQFPVTSDIAANADWIRRQMREAAARSADIVHFSECALSGYAGVDFKGFDGFDWEGLRKETESILALARELHVWVVLGSSHRLGEGHKPRNALYVIDSEGRVVDRYDKRFCTGPDLHYYSPGNHFVTFTVNGVKCGLLVCFDLRFPELYRGYSELGVQLIFHSFYNAKRKAGDILPKIMPPTARARAATNAMFISMNNSSVKYAWPSRFITPDGLVADVLPLHEPGVMVNEVDTGRAYYDASGPYRADAIRGKLHSGEVVEDPRSRDRTCF